MLSTYTNQNIQQKSVVARAKHNHEGAPVPANRSRFRQVDEASTDAALQQLRHLIEKLNNGNLKRTSQRYYSASLSDAALDAALSRLSAFDPDAYRFLTRAAVSSIRPEMPSLPPPYAGLAGQSKRRSAQSGYRSQEKPRKAVPGADQLVSKLSSASRLSVQDLVANTSTDFDGNIPAIDDCEEPSVRTRARVHHQLMDPDEQQVAKEWKVQDEADGGPPEGRFVYCV